MCAISEWNSRKSSAEQMEREISFALPTTFPSKAIAGGSEFHRDSFGQTDDGTGRRKFIAENFTFENCLHTSRIGSPFVK